MLEGEWVRRHDSKGNAVAEIAMWRIRRKPEYQRAEKQCPGVISASAIHAAHDK